MSGKKYQATDKQREAQRRIAHTCDCGREIRGNVGWLSHLKANPTHSEVPEVTGEDGGVNPPHPVFGHDHGQ